MTRSIRSSSTTTFVLVTSPSYTSIPIKVYRISGESRSIVCRRSCLRAIRPHLAPEEIDVRRQEPEREQRQRRQAERCELRRQRKRRAEREHHREPRPADAEPETVGRGQEEREEEQIGEPEPRRAAAGHREGERECREHAHAVLDDLLRRPAEDRED